eukprot:11386749-Alexandrium_andersonii.AAC.1
MTETVHACTRAAHVPHLKVPRGREQLHWRRFRLRHRLPTKTRRPPHLPAPLARQLPLTPPQAGTVHPRIV